MMSQTQRAGAPNLDQVPGVGLARVGKPLDQGNVSAQAANRSPPRAEGKKYCPLGLAGRAWRPKPASGRVESNYPPASCCRCNLTLAGSRALANQWAAKTSRSR